MTIKSILIVFSIGLCVGLLILWIRSSKIESDALQRGKTLAEDALRSREIDVSKKEQLLVSREKKLEADYINKQQLLKNREHVLEEKALRFKAEADRIKSEFPQPSCTTPVLIATSPALRSLYHRADSFCIQTGHKVSMKTAMELGLKPCSRCKPVEIKPDI